MVDIFFIYGTPGSGKTTISNLLKSKLNSPLIDLGWIREFHLDEKWSKLAKQFKRIFIFHPNLHNKINEIIPKKIPNPS